MANNCRPRFRKKEKSAAEERVMDMDGKRQ